MCKGHKGHCSLGLECSSGHRLIFLCSVHNQLFGYRASLLSAHVLAVVYFLLTSFPVGSHAPSQANAPSPLTWLESGLPVNIKSQYGLQMFFLCHPRSRFSLLFWIFFFLTKGTLKVLWATMPIPKCSQQGEAPRRAGFCCHHLKITLIWN